MNHRHCARAAVAAAFAASGLALAGCVSSPTYGTDKTASEQLVGDLTGALSLAPTKRAPIDYKPRPELVKPAPGQKETLPPPQDSITQSASAQWPESPEQRRARLRDEATKHQGDVNYEPQIVDDVHTGPASADAPDLVQRPPTNHSMAPKNTGAGMSAAARRAEINRRLAEANQGDPTARKYLSEPPLTYREPAATAPQNDIGEDELKKERRLKKEAAAKSGKSSWSDWLPW